ncbi:MAG: ribonuclease D [Pseudomonadota bacterium]
MKDVDYIDTAEALEQFCNKHSSEDTLMLDTEFLRERTYQPKLCLIQLASAQGIGIIDPLNVSEKQTLWELLSTRTLVMHAARQDLEVFEIEFGALPERIFDTQIAAGLCGYAPQIGYGALVESICGVTLDKAHTRTDWSRRPLSDSELEYAADDVRYLPAVLDTLSESLAEKNRLCWAEADSALQLRPELYALDFIKAQFRVKGLSRLRGLSHARARALSRWREEKAVNRNLPRQWVLKDAEILALAEVNPDSSESVAAAFLSAASAKRHGHTVARLLRETTDDGQDIQPRARPDAEEKALAKQLGKKVTDVAQTLSIEAEVLAPMKEVRAIAAGERDTRVNTGWRRELLGAELTRIADAGA